GRSRNIGRTTSVGESLVQFFAPTLQSQQRGVLVAQPWSEEFNGPANSRPDPTRWTYDLGANGWGNNELEDYTNSAENAHMDGQGPLVIHVVKQPNGHIPSARMKTQGLVNFQYGDLVIRAKIPTGQGYWAAGWMLGATFNGGNWPGAGEIDIMENRGREPSRNFGTVHGPGYSGGGGISGSYYLPNGQRLSDDFHDYGMHWAPGEVSFSVDGHVYHTVRKDEVSRWVFDQPFFLLLNVAVGGNFGGDPDSTTRFPQDLLVDSIRYTPLAG